MVDLVRCVLQDVLTDLSAECENLPIEGVSGACYGHKVSDSPTLGDDKLPEYQHK